MLEQGLLLSGHAPTIAKDTVKRRVVRMQAGVRASLTLHWQCCLYYLLPEEE